MNSILPFIIFIIASVGALSGALISQYGFGYHPCELCIWQRIPYIAIIAIGLFGLFAKFKTLALALVFLTLTAGTAIATYHFGIEQNFWEGFQECSNVGDAGTLEEMKAQIMNAPVVRCDEISFEFLSLSMAAWNMLYSAALTLLALFLLWKRKYI